MQDRWNDEHNQRDKDGQKHHSKKRPVDWEDRLNRKKNKRRRGGRRELIEDLRLTELEDNSE